MDDWLQEADAEREDASAGRVLRAHAVDEAAVGGARGLPRERTLAGTRRGRRRRRAPRRGRRSSSWRSGSSRPCSRSRSAPVPASRRTTACSPACCPPIGRACASGSAPYDVVLVVGARRVPPVAHGHAGRFTEEGTRVALVTEDPAEAHRSPVELAVLAPPAAAARALAGRLPQRDAEPPQQFRSPPAPAPPRPGEPLTASHVLAALAERLPAEAVVLEEAPVDRPEIHDRLLARGRSASSARRWAGSASASPAAAGLRMALPGPAGGRRARRRRVALRDPGALERRPLPRRRALRDPLERRLRDHGPPRRAITARTGRGRASARSTSPRSRGASAARRGASTTHDELVAALDEAIPTLAGREQPLLLDVVIAPTTTFAP